MVKETKKTFDIEEKITCILITHKNLTLDEFNLQNKRKDRVPNSNNDISLILRLKTFWLAKQTFEVVKTIICVLITHKNITINEFKSMKKTDKSKRKYTNSKQRQF